jgi:hypothetical protein
MTGLDKMHTSISSKVGRLGCSFASTRRPGCFLSSTNTCHSLDAKRSILSASKSITYTFQMFQKRNPITFTPNRRKIK